MQLPPQFQFLLTRVNSKYPAANSDSRLNHDHISAVFGEHAPRRQASHARANDSDLRTATRHVELDASWTAIEKAQ